MTNDLHALAFRFPQGRRWIDSDYGYDPIYYSIVLWLLLCGVSFLIILLYKCRVPQSRKFIWLPGVPVMILLAYVILYLLRVPWLFVFFGDLPAAFCLCYVAILEGCMQTGLIQTNTGYDMLFEVAAVQAQITMGTTRRTVHYHISDILAGLAIFSALAEQELHPAQIPGKAKERKAAMGSNPFMFNRKKKRAE